MTYLSPTDSDLKTAIDIASRSGGRVRFRNGKYQIFRIVSGNAIYLGERTRPKDVLTAVKKYFSNNLSQKEGAKC